MSQQGLRGRLSPRFTLAGSQRGLRGRLSLRFTLAGSQRGLHRRLSPRFTLAGSQRGLRGRLSPRFPLAESQRELRGRLSPRFTLAESQRGLRGRLSLRFTLVVDVEKVHPRRSHLSVTPSGIFLHSSTYLTLTSGAFVPKSMFPLSKVKQMPNEPLVFSVNGFATNSHLRPPPLYFFGAPT